MATTIGDLLDKLTVRGELYRKLSDDTIECYACGHRCKIREGKRGICQVRFNAGRGIARAVGLCGGAAERPDREETLLPRDARNATR